MVSQARGLNRLIAFSLRHRAAVLLAAAAVMAYGVMSVLQMPIDIFPDLDRPRVVVMTEAPGLAPEEVESLITYPLESALLGANGVEAVRTQSGPGLSVVQIEFDWSAQIMTARQAVQERLTAAAESIPREYRPQMAPIGSILGQIVHVGLATTGATLDEKTALEIRSFADWVLRPQLLKIPGVAQVVVMGGGRKQFQILIDPNRMVELGVALPEVVQAIEANNLNASGGFFLDADAEQAIRVLGRLGREPSLTVAEIGNLPVKTLEAANGSPSPTAADSAGLAGVLRVRHLGRVVEGPDWKRGDAGIDGKPAVILTISKQPHADTREVTRRIENELRKLASSAPAGSEIRTDLFQLRRFIDHGIFNVGEALAIGAALVTIILFLFLLNFRTTAITLTAIPLSLAATAIVFRWLGWLTGLPTTINVMTLGGIAVAMGELVDDAIVDVENIYRRLTENAGLAERRPVQRVVYEASAEIRGAIVFGTAMVVLVFVPLFALPGIEGRLFAPLGAAYIISILASLLVSLTVTPVLSYYLLPGMAEKAVERQSPVLAAMKRIASPIIRLSMRFPGALLLTTWIAVAGSAWWLTRLGADFLPAFDEGTVQVNMSLPPGSSLEASVKTAQIADRVFRRLLQNESNPNGLLASFTRRTGRAELDEHAEPPSSTEFLLQIAEGVKTSRSEVIADLLRELQAEVPGAVFEVEQPLAHLISHMLSGVTAQVAIKIFGADLGSLRGLAERVQSELADIPGVASLAIESQRQTEEVHIRLRPDRLAYYGVDRRAVAEFVQTALLGKIAGEVLDGDRRFDLVVRLDEPFRSERSKLSRLRFDLPDGHGQVSLGELAVIEEGNGPNVVYRENGRRRIVVRANALGRDLGSVVRDIRSRLDSLEQNADWPKGYTIELGGQFESQQRATYWIAILATLALVGMYVVLYSLYPSARIVLQILNALPAAFVGGVIALAATGQTVTVASLVGFISLAGIAARNGILLVSHYFHLMRHEGEDFAERMVLRGSLERLAPVLMTALTAGIGLLPLVLEGHKPGREILYPVATVIVGGLCTSTLCEYLLHPGLFFRFSGKDATNIAFDKEHE